MNFAVIKLAGKQFLVSPGSKVEIQADLGDVGQKLQISEVMLTSDGETTEFGAPFLTNQKISATIVSSGKGEKIRVSKFKAKSRYRRVIGFRPNQTILQVEDFGEVKSTKNSPASTSEQKKAPAKNKKQ